MATLEKIRNHAVILVIAIGLALLAFLLGDFLRQSETLSRDSKTNAISVNGHKIKIHDYQARVDQAMENYRAQSRNASLTDEQTNQLRNQVYAQIVSERILDEETEKLGLVVSPKETFDLVQGDFLSPVIVQSPMFANPQTGAFDRATMLNFLKSIDAKQMAQYTPEQRQQVEKYRSMWISTEASVRDFRLNEKYTTLISKALVANKLELADALNAASESADIAFVSQKAIAYPDSIVKVGDKEVKEFYDKHKQLFKTEPGRIVDVVYTSILPSQEDVEATHQDVLSAEKELRDGVAVSDVVSEYSDQEYIDSYMPLSFFRNELFPTDLADQLTTAEAGYVTPVSFSNNTYRVAKLEGVKVAPDSLLVRHIVLPAASQKVEGVADVDSLFNVVKANPSEFANVAKQYSLDRNSSANGGEIGWLTEYTASKYIDQDFSAKLFTAPIGTPIRLTSRFGEHIVQVEKATAPIRKYLVAYVSKTASPSNKTYTKIYNDMNSFLAKNKTSNVIDTAAISHGYQVLRDMPVYGVQPNIASGVNSSRELVRWALSHDEKEISDIKECGDKFAIVIIRKEIEKGFLPISEAKAQILPVVTNQAKVDYLYNQLKTKNYTSLEAFAKETQLPLDTIKYVQFASNRIESIGFEPSINAIAGYAPTSKVMPVKGLAGVYLVDVLSRSKDNTPPKEDAVRATLENERANLVRVAALQTIISKADIEDNRVRFY